MNIPTSVATSHELARYHKIDRQCPDSQEKTPTEEPHACVWRETCVKLVTSGTAEDLRTLEDLMNSKEDAPEDEVRNHGTRL